jgi:amino acid adenylation domain-containing protein
MIWIGQMMNPLSPQYNMAFAFTFEKDIDIDRFAQSFQTLINLSDVLRSTFNDSEGVPKMGIRDQYIYDQPYFQMSQEDWEAWKIKQTEKVFDLSENVFYSALVKIVDGPLIWYINQHHLITDGWSFALLYNELSKIYNDGGLENSPSFQPFQVQEKSLKAATAHWDKVVADEVSIPLLNGKANENLSPYSSRIRTSINQQQTVELKELVSSGSLRLWSTDLGLFTFFSTVLASTINRLTHNKLISIGAPALNRINTKQKNTLGLFIEMFPLEAQISTGETYESLYKKMSLSANNFLRYAVSGASSAELSKRFNVVLNFINASFESDENFKASSEWIHPGASDPGHHVRLQVTDFDSSGSLHLFFDLNNSVFSDQEKTRFVETFFIEMDSFKSGLKKLINPDEEKELAFIKGVNQTFKNYPKNITYLDLFNEQVRQNSDAIAVVFEGQNLTFKQLDEKSNQLANYLIQAGVQKEEPVGVILDRSLELMVALVGINKASAAYVPIDINYPQERIDYIIEDAVINVVVKHDFNWDELENKDKSVPDVRVYPTDLMYIIYTSGSTGKPKGVMNQHSGVFNRLFWAINEFKLDLSDALLQKTNYTFDVSVGELFLPLIKGCKLVLAKPEGHRDSDYLKYIIDKEKIASIHFVPPMLEVFLLSVKPGDCPSLKYVLCSGEALKPEQVNAFREVFPEVELYNLYGPTEAAIEVSKWIAPKNVEVQKVTIGRPMPNVQLKIVDAQENECPFEVPGELLIGGVQVARGYRNKEVLTAQRFFEKDGIRWYRTGDLCQWLRDGNVEYLGRIDNQVKVRGFRVELGEIEETLKQHEDVRNAVVLVKRQSIIAYVVQNGNPDIDAYLRSRLPEYMIPSQYISVEEIPFMNNGKINRQRLLSLKEEHTIVAKPGNEFEEFVHDIWSKVLNVSDIDINDNFFRIGGDSLTGIRVITSINAELDLDFPVVLIFQNSTIKGLAAFIESEIDKRLEEA